MPSITIAPANYGTVYVAGDRGFEVVELEEGETGTIVQQPEEGYYLDQVWVNGVQLEGNEFQMPAVDATVTPVFAELETVEVSLDNVAEAANNVQWFWTDDDGAHVTDVPQDEWKQAVTDGFPDMSDAKPYANSLLTSTAQLFRSGLSNLVRIGRRAVEFFDGLGNTDANVVASFGADGVVIGKRNGIHAEVTPSYFNLCDENDNAPFYVSPSGALNWRRADILPYKRPDSDGIMHSGIEYGETVSYRMYGAVDLASRPLSVFLQYGWGDKTITADGDYTIGGPNGMGVTVASDADGVTVSLTNNREGFYYEFGPITKISGWAQAKDFVISLNSRAGITQTVTIGDKTLIITGGIITGVS